VTSGHARSTRRALPPALALLLGVLLLVAPFPWTSSPVAANTAEACVADASTGCIGGTIRTSAGEPAVGVVLTVEGQGQTVEATTDDTGRWSAAVTAAGEYAVTVDEETLPDGESLRDPAANPRTVTVELGGTTGALFPLGAPAAGGGGGGGGGAPTAEAPTTGDGGAAVPPDGEGGDEAEVAPESAAAQGGGTSSRIVQLVASGLIFGLLLALASVGLSLLYGTTGLSNFAHGEQVTLGALLAYFFAQVQNLPLPVAGALAVLGGLLSGYLQHRGIWGPLRRRGVGLVQQIIVTIGLSLSLQYLFNLLAGGGTLRIVTSSPGIVQLGPVRLTEQSAVSVVLAVLVLAGVGYFLTGTRTGRATRAVADNASLAAASGIAVDRIVRLVWTVGAGLAALGGVLLGLYLNATRWNMGTALLLLMFAAVTLGGLGTAFGALVGSLIIGLVVELSTLVLPSDMRYAAALLILIVVLLLRPQGILGRAERIG
jgi:branched-subunit amino acid ABC-type transport system permease component